MTSICLCVLVVGFGKHRSGVPAAKPHHVRARSGQGPGGGGGGLVRMSRGMGGGLGDSQNL
jgi:hypothetical protein